MFDISVTRHPPGLSVSTPNGMLSDMYVPDRIAKVHEYSDDFDPYVAGNYTVTLGGGAVAAIAGDGGLITETTAVSAATIIQRVPATFQLAKGFRAWGRFVSQVDSVLGAVVLGLINATAAPFTPANITDGIYMLTDGTGAVSFILALAGAKTTLASGVILVANQPFTFEFYYDGAAYAAGQPNGRALFQITGPGVSANFRGEIGAANAALPMPAGFPGAVNLAPIAGINATTAVARVQTLDTMYVAKDRSNINATPAF
jgi:hypothetical protein